MTHPNAPAGSLPSCVIHADWSIDEHKRWMAQATLRETYGYLALLPERVGEPETLLQRLKRSEGAEGCVLIGFDFPIGLPHAYAQRAEVRSFLKLLPVLGSGEWASFFDVASTSEQISLHRPFYPARPGSALREHLAQALGLPFAALLRQCERSHAWRRAACPLFWTLGGQQVGKSALHGWRQVLIPGLKDGSLGLRIWPFHGPLASLLRPGRLVIAETYPGEFYHHLGLAFPRRRGGQGGKRSQSARTDLAPSLLAWAAGAQVQLVPGLLEAIQDGFGGASDGEDRFDALAGLFGMLNLLLGRRPLFEPEGLHLQRIEGWILGQDPDANEAGGYL